MNFTLKELIDECEKAIPIYRDIAEDEGMSGDVDAYEMYDKEAIQLEKLIKAIREQLQLNKILSIGSCAFWLNSDENKEVKRILISALELVRDRREYEKRELQKEIDFCNLFLNCKELRL